MSLNFNKVKLLIDIKSFDLKVKFINPKIVFNENEITFFNIDFIISLKSYLSNESVIKNIKIKTNKVELEDFLDFTRLTYPSPFVFIVKNTIKKGVIVGETELSFNKKGELIENYEIIGSIFNLETKILPNHKIQKIDFKIKKDFFKFKSKDFNLYDLQFHTANINIKKNKRDLNFTIDSKSSGKINNIDKFLNNFDYKLINNNIKFSNLDLTLNNKVNFTLKNFFKFKNFRIKGSGKINNLTLSSDDFKKYKKYFKINKIVKFKNHEINYDYSNDKLKFKTTGKFNLKNKFENFKSEIKIDYKNNLKDIRTDLDLDSLEINFKNLNYKKLVDSKANLKIDIILEKNYKIIKNLKFTEQKNNIEVINLKLNNKYQVVDFNQILINTFKNRNFNNNFKIIKKRNQINVVGSMYDATNFLKTLNDDGKSKIFNKKFNSNITFKIKEIISEEDTIFDFNGNGKINFGKFYKLNVKSKFSNKDFLEISIVSTNLNKRKLFIYSDRAKLFVSNFKFVKGFAEGKLEYTSDYNDQTSISNLKIYDFKIKDVPALAKLLSLASLQGIADILTGEGIRFKEFELDFKSENKVITIEEMYAIGPAISILMSGYIDKNKVISLRGTLVPATTVNKAIGSIPFIGKILVGNKTGEGVFGVSFKIKGPPKNLKTTVNPIKTLTPRFITRTLEKIKKLN